MQKNEIYEIEITGQTSEGDGVGRVHGMAVFVPYALNGETVEAKILRVNKTYAYGKLLRVIIPSESREEPKCPVFYRCGGCGLQHMSYEAELEFKTDKVKQVIKRIGGLDTPVEPCVGSPLVYGYRNKAQYPVGMLDDMVFAGFYAKRTHDIIPCNSCLIQSDVSQRCAGAVIEYMTICGVRPYSEKTGKGLIRHIYVRCGKNSALLTIVTNGNKLPYPDGLIETVRKYCPEITGIVQNVNSKKTNVVMGSECETLWGESFLTDELCGLTFEISPLSFYQVNHDQTENLYQKALELADLTGEETLLDLYCGIGTISLFMAKHAKKVYGVEIIEDAVKNARRNAEINGIENAEFFVGDAKTAESFKDVDVVVIDPPRAGCEIEVIDHIINMSPKKVIYISCNPSTLARDLKIFNEKSYIPQSIHPYDLFPRTEHVETVVLITRV